MKLFYILISIFGLLSCADAAETNAVTSVFHHYDETNISKISDHFIELMDSMPPYKRQSPRGSVPGRVDMTFHLHADGKIDDLNVESTTVEEARVEICKKAILDLAPFASWPTDIRRAFTNDFRVVHYTFNFR